MALILKGRSKLKGSTVIGKRPYAIDGVFNPELVLDFQKEFYRTNSVAKTFADAITHTRASTATYVDSNGILQTAAINEPRVGHHVWNGTAWVNEGLLHESEARTNLFAQSNDFSTWSASNATVTDNAVTGLDGLTSASTVVQASTTASSHVIFTSAAVTSGTTYTFSTFVKYVDWRYVNLDVSDGSFGNPARATFDLVNGVVTDGSNGNDTIENWGNGWWRIAMSVPATATNTSSFFVSFNEGSTFDNTFNGDGTSSFVIFGAQLEAAPTPSSYIPTAGSTVTRSADVLTIPAANLPYPEPVVIGPELGNPDNLDKRAGTDGTVTRSGGVINFVSAVSGLSTAISEQITGLTIGEVYRFTAQIRFVSGSPVALHVRSGSGGGGSVLSSSGSTISSTFVSMEVLWVATATSAHFSIIASTGSEFEVQEASYSVREINPLALSIQMDGRVTYANTWVSGTKSEFSPFRWLADSNNFINHVGDSLNAGDTRLTVQQRSSGVSSFSTVSDFLSPGILVPINTASRHGSNFLRSAADGVLGGSATPTALPDLSTTNLTLGSAYNGTIRTFRMWGQDIGDAGLVEATEPSLVPSLSLTFDGTENSFIVEDWSE